jgi:methionyl-tRNA formyltransferase
VSPFSVVFCGTSAFALPCLEAVCADDRFRVTAVITQPDKPVGRKQLLTPPPVKTLAARLNLPVFQPVKINAEWKDIAAKVERPDFLVAVSYGQILSQEILDFATRAPVNVHASLLPELRGASPIQHAILLNHATSGVTVQRMVKELDAGPVLGQTALPLKDRETSPVLHDKLAAAGATLLLETLAKPLKEAPQDAAKATFCRKLSRADGVVDPATMPAADIDRRVRALTPWPGVTWNDMKILETSLNPQPDAFSLTCANSTTLYIVSLQPAGKKPMTGGAYARGLRTPSL